MTTRSVSSSARSAFASSVAALAATMIMAATASAATKASSSARTAHADAELVANVTSVAPGDSFWVALRLRPDSGWHVYWSNPGDAGMPPALIWRPPSIGSAGPLLFPVPERFETPPLASFGYGNDVWYPVKVRAGTGVPEGPRAHLRAQAEWLICREECLPESAALTLTLGTGVTAVDDARAHAWAAALARLPEPQPDRGWHATYEDSAVVIAWDAGDERDVFFFPAEQGVILHAAAQTLSVDGGRARLTIRRDDVLRARPDTLRGVLAFGSGESRRGYELAIPAGDAAGTAAGLLPALLVGLFSLAVLVLIFVLKRPHVTSGTDRRA